MPTIEADRGDGAAIEPRVARDNGLHQFDIPVAILLEGVAPGKLKLERANEIVDCFDRGVDDEHIAFADFLTPGAAWQAGCRCD